MSDHTDRIYQVTLYTGDNNDMKAYSHHHVAFAVWVTCTFSHLAMKFKLVQW